MTVADGNAFVTALEDAAQQGTGCLYVSDAHATRSGRVFFDDTKVYAVHVDGFMPKVGYRLRTGGMLTPEQYDTLLAQVGDDPYAPNFGGLAVEEGYITLDVLNAVLREILLSSVGAMFGWSDPVTKFKRNASTDQFVIPPVKVASIVKAVDKRRDRWAELWSQIAAGLSPENAYPVVTGGFGPDEEVSSEVAAVLAAATGTRSLDAVAGECGLTRFETGHVLGHLVGNNIVTIHAEPTGPREHTEHTGGTAEAATADPAGGDPAPTFEAETSVAPIPVSEDAGSQPTEPAPEAQADIDADTDEGTGESTDYAAVHTTPEALPHFAPDVIETVEVVEHTVEDSEPSAFGDAEAVLPDGTDKGTIPTEQIEHDPEDIPATATVPPLHGLPTGEGEAAPLPDAQVGFVAPPVEADFARDLKSAVREEPELMQVVHDGETPPESPEVSMPVAPADVPVFVDASAFNAQQAPADAVVGLPGVPLPPLPEFLPVPPVPAPVFETEAVQIAAVEEATEPVEAHVVDQPEETPELAVEPVTEPVSLPVTEPVHAEEAAEPVVVAADDRAVLARQRLEEEISVADEVLAAARSALDRATTEFDSHTVAATQMQETLHRYEQFLDSAIEDQSRLSHDAETLSARREDTRTLAETAQSQAEVAADEARSATDEVAAAREALANAEQALADAEHRLQTAQQAEEDATITATDAARTAEELDARIETVTADLRDAQERVASHTEEIKDVRQMSDSVAQAQQHAAVLREEAQQRLETAHRNLAAKRERLAQLD